MKNLLIFVSPILNGFNKEHEVLAKIQIDWSLEMGWKQEDIWLVTNFPYEYHGVKAIQVEDDCYYPDFNRATKVPVINRLYEKGLIKDVVWFHDFDAFQFKPLDVKSDFAVTQYGKCSKCKENKWNAGSFFFKDAHDTFKLIEKVMYDHGIDEENALTYMFNHGFTDYELLDIKYNTHIYSPITEDILVAHFHPFKPHHRKLFEDILPLKLKELCNTLI